LRWKVLLRSKLGISGLIVFGFFVLLAISGPYISPKNPFQQNLRAMNAPPGTPGYVLGADELGRDILSRIIHGARMTLGLAGLSLVIALAFGVPAGIAAGYYGGWVDNLIMRANDALLAVPRFLVAIVIVALFGIRYETLVLATGIGLIPDFARVVRSSTLTLVEREFVMAAKAMGARDATIMRRHILPNAVGPIIVQASFGLGSGVLIIGGLSFLGLGVQPPTPEWGSMLSQGRRLMVAAPHLILWPGIALSLAVLSVNILGDALRYAYDPRFRGAD